MRKFIILVCLFTLSSAGVSFAGFEDNGNGTVTDTSTKLVWQKETHPEAMYWQAALKHCEDLPLAGLHWRLPDINELQSLVDYTKVDPAIDEVFSDDVKGTDHYYYWYWSSTTNETYPYYAWYVYFTDGYVYNDSKTYYYGYVRCVSSGQ